MACTLVRTIECNGSIRPPLPRLPWQLRSDRQISHPLGSIGQQARGPGFNNVDSSLFKNFTVSDAVRVQLHAETFNTFNSAQFAQPSSSNYTNTTTFGSITSLRNGPRVMQLALKLFDLALETDSSLKLRGARCPAREVAPAPLATCRHCRELLGQL